MKTVAAVIAVVALAGSAAAQTFQLNTPTAPVECVPTQFTWTGGQPPYTLLIQSGSANGNTLTNQVYTGLTGNSFSWSTNITAGTTLGATLRDANGQPAQTAPFTIDAGADSSCLNNAGTPSASVSNSAPSDSSASTPAAASSPSASTPAASSSSHSSSSSGASSHASSSSGAAPSPSTSSAAMAQTATMGAVGFFGALLAVFLA